LFIGLQNPAVASAGALSLISSLFSKAEAQDTTTLPAYQGNSQTTQLLSAAKHRDPNPSRGGGDITVEDGALVAENIPGLAGTEHQHGSGEISVYIVREGDALSQIASMFNVSVNTIIWANDLKRGVPIHKDQTLLILPISGIQHTVTKGETIAKIAKQYGGDEAEILQYNGLASSEALVVGATITIPGGEETAPTAVASTKPAPTTSVKVGVTTKSTKSVANGYYTNPVPGGTAATEVMLLSVTLMAHKRSMHT
jgi:LysM repeat protein